ncbi:MAG: hypothetical protein OXH24_08085, partial [Cyanobacteria bacterium MAG IRC3_bin_20]|nr:hypothetical protein [Cyanobacteria bacterium MAG IRC3_bin_20]
KPLCGPLTNTHVTNAHKPYGFPAFADRLTLAPALALALSSTSRTRVCCGRWRRTLSRPRGNRGRSAWRVSGENTSPPLPQRIIP